MKSIINNAKTALLMGVMMSACLAAGYMLGGINWMFIALSIGAVMNIVMYYFSDSLALASMRARQIERCDDPEYWDLVEILSKRAKIPMPRVYVAPAEAPNAFATGRNPAHSAVCVTVGLRKLLNDEELAGVIAHELSHVKNRDILISTIASIMAGAIMMLSRLAFFFGGSRNSRSGNPLAALVILIVGPIAALLIQMAISRSREYEADRSAAELVGSPNGLARALEKLSHGSSQIPLVVPPAQSNMFIVAPLSLSRGAANLFTTHPPVEKRVAALMGSQEKHS